MTINVYFWTDIRTIKPKDGTIYAATTGITPKGKEAWVTHTAKVKANNAKASVKALHDVIAGDEHHIKPYQGNRIVIHSTCQYVTMCLYTLKKWAGTGWKTSKGADIAHKEEWQEINCNLQGNHFEVIDEKTDSEAVKGFLAQFERRENDTGD